MDILSLRPRYTCNMLSRHERGKVTWIDLESPTRDELQMILSEFNVDARIEEEMIAPTPYPLFVPFPSYLYLILHFPVTDTASGTRDQEIDFIVGKNFLITARYEVIDSIHNLHKVFEAEELLGLPAHPSRADTLLERVIRRLYGAIKNEVERTAHALDRIERDIFSGKERQAVHTISDTARILLRVETTLERHREPLSVFLKGLAAPAFFGKGFSEHSLHIEAEREHVATLVASYRAVATELRDTNDSLLSASQNEIMKVLTIMAFVTFPLTLISSIFGMNTDYLPIVGTPHDFWIVMGLMIALAISFFSYFRFKRWL